MIKKRNGKVTFLILLLILNKSFEQCPKHLIEYCSCFYEPNQYIITCRSDQNGRISNQLNENDFRTAVRLKLEGTNLELIKNSILSQIQLDTLDLSNNNKDFQEYLTAINSLRNLKVLGLSHNKISKTRIISCSPT